MGQSFETTFEHVSKGNKNLNLNYVSINPRLTTEIGLLAAGPPLHLHVLYTLLWLLS